jgi:hypothetical protein
MKNRLKDLRKYFKKTNEKEFSFQKIMIEDYRGRPGREYSFSSFICSADIDIEASSKKHVKIDFAAGMEVLKDKKIRRERTLWSIIKNKK